jgi:hypothetical protein
MMLLLLLTMVLKLILQLLQPTARWQQLPQQEHFEQFHHRLRLLL